MPSTLPSKSPKASQRHIICIGYVRACRFHVVSFLALGSQRERNFWWNICLYSTRMQPICVWAPRCALPPKARMFRYRYQHVGIKKNCGPQRKPQTKRFALLCPNMSNARPNVRKWNMIGPGNIHVGFTLDMLIVSFGLHMVAKQERAHTCTDCFL